MGNKFSWKLSPVETAGVVAIGAGMGFVANMLSGGTPEQRKGRRVGTMVAGTVIYTTGVAIGNNRPKGGYLKMGGKKRKRIKG